MQLLNRKKMKQTINTLNYQLIRNIIKNVNFPERFKRFIIEDLKVN